LDKHYILELRDTVYHTLDHHKLTPLKYESPSSTSAIEFIKSELQSALYLTDSKLRIYCSFYLLLIAQLSPNKLVRDYAYYEFVNLYDDHEKLLLVKKYWLKIGKRKYHAGTENYFKTWDRFIRIRKDNFLNIDYPIWILIIEHYASSFYLEGWTWNNIEGNEGWYLDQTLLNMRNIMEMEQLIVDIHSFDCIHLLPESTFAYMKDPDRFNREDDNWIDAFAKIKFI
jgi:hypothetical protein